MRHIVVDLEMNPVSREFRSIKRQLSDEIIEIGAVRLDEDFKRLDEFQCYVRPEYGEIYPHITKLTGITNEMVQDKDNFQTCFAKFLAWIGGEDTVYSWSMSDFNQIQMECQLKNPGFDAEKSLLSRWVDLQKEFDSRLGLTNSLALKHALGAMDHSFEGTQHTALDDAINTSSILVLMQDEAAFREKMKPVLELLAPQEDLSSTIGDLCPELSKLVFGGSN